MFRVTLSNTGVTDEHLKYLDAFPALTLLSLAHTQVSDAGLAPYRRTDGSYRLSNEFHYLIASA